MKCVKLPGKCRQSSLKYILILYVFFTFLFLLLRFFEKTSSGVREGINLCLQSLIPSLYPFMIVTELFNSTGIMTKDSRVLKFLSLKLFRLPYSFGVFVLSCLGGYPVGAACIGNLMKKGIITKNEGERMFSFTVNPSLSFVVFFVGAALYKSIKAGVILYISVIAASFLFGVVSAAFCKDKPSDFTLPVDETETNLSVAFTTSVKKSAVSMFYICAFTVLFSVACELVEIAPFSAETELFIKCILEVTNGIKSACNRCSLPFIAFVLSFGGLSVAFQIFSNLSEHKISAARFFKARLISGLLSNVIALFLFKIFPVTVSTFSTSAVNHGALTSHSVPVSVGLILMTVILIADDGYMKEKRS